MEGKAGIKLCELGLGNGFLNRTTNHKQQKKNLVNLASTKIRTLVPNTIIKKVKSQLRQ